MKTSFTNVIAGCLIMFGAAQVGATSVTGTIMVQRDASRSIKGAYLVTEKKDSQGKNLALVLAMDENGKSIAQQYENKQIKIEGNIQGKNLTAIEWKEVKDTSYNSSSSSYKDEPANEPEESYEDSDSDEEDEDGETKKKSSKPKKGKSKKKSSDDEDEESEDSDDEEEVEESEDSNDDEGDKEDKDEEEEEKEEEEKEDEEEEEDNSDENEE